VAQSEWTWSWTLSSKRFTWIHAQSRSFTSARLSTARDSNLQRVHLPWPSPWRINETRCHNHATWPLRSHMNGSARSGIIAFVRDDWSVAKEKLSAQRSRVRRCRVSRIGPALPLGQKHSSRSAVCSLLTLAVPPRVSASARTSAGAWPQGPLHAAERNCRMRRRSSDRCVNHCGSARGLCRVVTIGGCQGATPTHKHSMASIHISSLSIPPAKDATTTFNTTGVLCSIP
jgi:hypothetical protein